MALPPITGVKPKVAYSEGQPRPQAKTSSLINTDEPSGFQKIAQALNEKSKFDKAQIELAERMADDKVLNELYLFASNPDNTDLVREASKTGDYSKFPAYRPTRQPFLAALPKTLSSAMGPGIASSIKDELNNLPLSEDPQNHVNKRIEEETAGLPPSLARGLKDLITKETVNTITKQRTAREVAHNETQVDLFRKALAPAVRAGMGADDLNKLTRVYMGSMQGPVAKRITALRPVIQQEVTRLLVSDDYNEQRRGAALEQMPLDALGGISVRDSLAPEERKNLLEQGIKARTAVLTEREQRVIREINLTIAQGRPITDQEIVDQMALMGRPAFGPETYKLRMALAGRKIGKKNVGDVAGAASRADSVTLSGKEITSGVVDRLERIAKNAADSSISNEKRNATSATLMVEIKRLIERAGPKDLKRIHANMRQLIVNQNNPDIIRAMFTTINSLTDSNSSYRAIDFFGQGEALMLWGLLQNEDMSTSESAAQAMLRARETLGSIRTGDTAAFSNQLKVWEDSDSNMGGNSGIDFIDSVSNENSFYSSFSEKIAAIITQSEDGIEELQKIIKDPAKISPEFNSYLNNLFTLAINSASAKTFNNPEELIKRAAQFADIRRWYSFNGKIYPDRSIGFRKNKNGDSVRLTIPSVGKDVTDNVIPKGVGTEQIRDVAGVHALTSDVNSQRIRWMSNTVLELPLSLEPLLSQPSVLNNRSNIDTSLSEIDGDEAFRFATENKQPFLFIGESVEAASARSGIDERDLKATKALIEGSEYKNLFYTDPQSRIGVKSKYEPVLRKVVDYDTWRLQKLEEKRGTFTIKNDRIYLLAPEKPEDSRKVAQINLDPVGSVFLHWDRGGQIDIRTDLARLPNHPLNSKGGVLQSTLAHFVQSPESVVTPDASESIYNLFAKIGPAVKVPTEELAEQAWLQSTNVPNVATAIKALGPLRATDTGEEYDQPSFKELFTEGELSPEQVEALRPDFRFEYFRRIKEKDRVSRTELDVTDEVLPGPLTPESFQDKTGELNRVLINSLIGLMGGELNIKPLPLNAPTTTTVNPEKPDRSAEEVDAAKELVRQANVDGSVSPDTAAYIEENTFTDPDSVQKAIEQEQASNNSPPVPPEVTVAAVTNQITQSHPLHIVRPSTGTVKQNPKINNNNPANISNKTGKPATFSTYNAGVQAAIDEIELLVNELNTLPTNVEGNNSVSLLQIISNSGITIGKPRKTPSPQNLSPTDFSGRKDRYIPKGPEQIGQERRNKRQAEKLQEKRMLIPHPATMEAIFETVKTDNKGNVVSVNPMAALSPAAKALKTPDGKPLIVDGLAVQINKFHAQYKTIGNPNSNQKMGSLNFSNSATKNKQPFLFTVLHDVAAQGKWSSAMYSNNRTNNRSNKGGHYSTGYHAIVKDGQVYLMAPFHVRTNGVKNSTPVVPGQLNENTYHIGFFDKKPESRGAALSFYTEVLVKEMGFEMEEDSVWAHGNSKGKNPNEGVEEQKIFKDSIFAYNEKRLEGLVAERVGVDWKDLKRIQLTKPSTVKRLMARMGVNSLEDGIDFNRSTEKGQKNFNTLINAITEINHGPTASKQFEPYAKAAVKGTPLDKPTDGIRQTIGHDFPIDWPDTTRILKDVGVRNIKEMSSDQYGEIVAPRVAGIVEQMPEWFDGASLTIRQQNSLIHFIYQSPWNSKTKRPLFVTDRLISAVDNNDHSLVAQIIKNETRVFTRNLNEYQKDEERYVTKVNRQTLAAEYLSHSVLGGTNE